MKHNKTKGAIAIKTKEGLLCEADKVVQHSFLNAKEKYSRVLGLEASAYAEIGCTEVQYSIFEIEGLQAQEKLIAERTSGKINSWAEYLKICEHGDPEDNHTEGGGPLQEEKEEEGATK